MTLSGVSPLLLLCFGYMAAFYGSYAYIGDHVHTVLDMPVRTTALITLAYGTGFGLAVWGDAIIDRVGVSRATPWTFATLVLVYLGLAAGSSAISVLVGVSLIWGIVNHFGLNLIIAGLSAIDPHRRGAILGAYSATTYLAASLSTFTYGWLYAATGFRGVTLVSSALIALVSIAAIQMNRRTALQPLRRRR